MGFKWPVDEQGHRKPVADFNDIEKVRYQVWQARVESTIDGVRYIRQEMLYLQNWCFYFEALAKVDQFDPEAVKYLQLEIVRLYKESNSWH